jgi:hypothetical protein
VTDAWKDVFPTCPAVNVTAFCRVVEGTVRTQLADTTTEDRLQYIPHELRFTVAPGDDNCVVKLNWSDCNAVPLN